MELLQLTCTSPYLLFISGGDPILPGSVSYINVFRLSSNTISSESMVTGRGNQERNVKESCQENQAVKQFQVRPGSQTDGGIGRETSRNLTESPPVKTQSKTVQSSRGPKEKCTNRVCCVLRCSE